jgi:hypothetical protein
MGEAAHDVVSKQNPNVRLNYDPLAVKWQTLEKHVLTRREAKGISSQRYRTRVRSGRKPA